VSFGRSALDGEQVLSNEAPKVEVPEELLGGLAPSPTRWPLDVNPFHESPLHSSDSGRDLSFFLEEAQGRSRSEVWCFLFGAA
jgi:hypothetical protein